MLAIVGRPCQEEAEVGGFGPLVRDMEMPKTPTGMPIVLHKDVRFIYPLRR